MENCDKYLLRITTSMKDYIAHQAKMNDRSINQEINHRLKLSKKHDEKKSFYFIKPGTSKD